MQRQGHRFRYIKKSSICIDFKKEIQKKTISFPERFETTPCETHIYVHFYTFTRTG